MQKESIEWPQFWAKQNLEIFKKLIQAYLNRDILPRYVRMFPASYKKVFTSQSQWFQTTEIQELQRPSNTKLQNFQGPIWFSKTFKSLKKNSRTSIQTSKVQELSRTVANP